MDSSINLVDFVTGRAKVARGKISTKEWCEILREVLWQIKPNLKYLDGFVRLDRLFDGKDELMTGRGRFVMAKEIMPSFNGTCFSEKTKFFPLALWQYQKQVGASCEERCGILLLPLKDNVERLLCLDLSYFRQSDHYVVCSCLVTIVILTESITNASELDGKCIGALINNGFVSVPCVLDRLYLDFNSTISKREAYLSGMRAGCEYLYKTYQRCSG